MPKCFYFSRFFNFFYFHTAIKMRLASTYFPDFVYYFQFLWNAFIVIMLAKWIKISLNRVFNLFKRSFQIDSYYHYHLFSINTVIYKVNAVKLIVLKFYYFYLQYYSPVGVYKNFYVSIVSFFNVINLVGNFAVISYPYNLIYNIKNVHINVTRMMLYLILIYLSCNIILF